MNKDQFIDFINNEIAHCNNESKRAFEGLKTNVEVINALPTDVFVFMNALDANLDYYCILFKKNNTYKKFLIETIDKRLVYLNGQKTFARFMHREDAAPLPYDLYNITYDFDANKLHREFRPAADKLVAWNRCMGLPLDQPSDRPSPYLLINNIIIEPVAPVAKLGYCVDCDEEESKYLIKTIELIIKKKETIEL